MNFPTSQTPPPPAPGQQMTPPMPPESAGPGLSQGKRLINMFFAPSKTFEDVRRKASWWVPWLVTGIFSIIFGVVAVQKLDIERFIEHEIEKSPAAQRRMEQVPPERRAQIISAQVVGTKWFFYLFPVATLIVGLLMAAIFMAIFNFILGGEVGFQRAAAVVFYSYVPFILSSVLLTISFLTSSDPNTIDLTNPMPTNPGFFMDPQGNRFLYWIITSLDIFSIWTVILMGLGFATVSSNRKPDTRTGITVMFVVFAIFVLGRAAWRAAFS